VVGFLVVGFLVVGSRVGGLVGLLVLGTYARVGFGDGFGVGFLVGDDFLALLTAPFRLVGWNDDSGSLLADFLALFALLPLLCSGDSSWLLADFLALLAVPPLLLGVGCNGDSFSLLADFLVLFAVACE